MRFCTVCPDIFGLYNDQLDQDDCIFLPLVFVQHELHVIAPLGGHVIDD